MRGAAKFVERCLWVIGFLALAAWCAVWFEAKWSQAEGNRELERRLEKSASSTSTSAAPSRSIPSSLAPLLKGDLIGRIEIPRIDVSTVIFEGSDDDVLQRGVGHLPGSPLPGETGNVVLAAHRDTFFRPLRYIRNRDRIDVVTPSGTRRYQVDATSIVTPDHVEVLAATPLATLTLVTCYPFDWFGHAPKRFIVRAHELDAPASVKTPSVKTPAYVKAQVYSAPAASDLMATVDVQPSQPSPARPHKPWHRRPALPHYSTLFPAEPKPSGFQTWR